MKKLTLSLVAIAAISTFSVAGGDIAPVEPVVETPVVVENPGRFYVGLGYGYFDQTSDNVTLLHQNIGNIEVETDNILFQAGYQINPYVAVEARYWLGIGDASITHLDGSSTDESGDYSSWGIYVKPMYPVSDNFNIYAMLGYGSTTLDVDNGSYWDTDEFSWGLGAEFGVTENVFIFADYVNLGTADSFDLYHNGNEISNVGADIDLYTFNFGVTYKF